MKGERENSVMSTRIDDDDYLEKYLSSILDMSIYLVKLKFECSQNFKNEFYKWMNSWP